MSSGVAISGWAAVAPNGRLTNADLEARVATSDAWIVERTGIHERRIAGPDESTATLATDAAAEAIKRAGLTPHDIDLMIVATVTPETLIPHTGAYVGERLGLRCGSFDLNAACSGFVYASVVASSLLRSGLRHVLVVGCRDAVADHRSRRPHHVHPLRRRSGRGRLEPHRRRQ